MTSGVISESVLVNLNDPRYFQHGGNLMINNPTSDDSGTYFCKANNYFGTAISNRVHLREISMYKIDVVEHCSYYFHCSIGSVRKT